MTAQPYKPEHRSIPLTFMDCPDHGEVTERFGQRGFVERQGIYDTHHCNFGYRTLRLIKHDQRGCRVNCDLGRCPRGFP